MTAEESTQLAVLIQKVDALDTFIRENAHDHEERIRRLEDTVSTLKERLTLWQIFQTGFTTIVGTIVAFIRRP